MLISEFYKLYNQNGLSIEVINKFRSIIYSFYKQKGRDFPFRKHITPYRVLVSEIMLQQTQTGRVSEKFLNFIKKFPDFLTLSMASIEDVLKEWKGLGYNRRAIALKKIAETIVNDFDGKLPESIEILKSFPQIGHNTASSIITFAFNKPTVFIETNIRRVYIYFFFHNKRKINDKDIMPIVEKTIDNGNPREWYYALMDYGVMLKKTHPELNKKSSHYRKQAKFEGSTRQIRGKILDLLIKQGTMEINHIQTEFDNKEPKKILNMLKQLEKEGFIEISNKIVNLKK